MTSLIPFLIPVALIIVLIILIFGTINMMRGKNPNRSQTLMRWRVFLQFVAILLIMTSLYFLQ
ncbi:twin transmembrane helix small protein [uncultured Cohaesibacter sp.]|uniref:twin transmembrane helix small protein n=1 Tax=uncultured Cohaesibacter sp. TaxID=1002546 RepID=UPI0029C6AE7D|nr:twin transmembrane helix small protein [uncultured Cohaesibacter sp.]